MLQVVFGDSEKASIIQAMHFKKEGFAYGVGPLFSGDAVLTEQERAAAKAEAERQLQQELARGKALDGHPEDAIALPFPLDIGDIRGSVFSNARKELLRQIFSAYPFEQEPEDPDSLEEYWAGCVDDGQRLLTRAAAGEPVRIWYSDAPYALCGFYCVLHMLRDMNCAVTAVKLPEYREQPDGSIVFSWSFGEISAGDWAAFLEYESRIPDVLRGHFAWYWNQLQQENAPLRALINGRLQSVEADFYDRFLLRAATAEPQTVGSVLGTALGRYGLRTGDWFLSRRVQALIDCGVFETIRQGKGFYNSLIKKCK